jgi:hypothetical protein
MTLQNEFHQIFRFMPYGERKKARKILLKRFYKLFQKELSKRCFTEKEDILAFYEHWNIIYREQFCEYINSRSIEAYEGKLMKPDLFKKYVLSTEQYQQLISVKKTNYISVKISFNK